MDQQKTKRHCFCSCVVVLLSGTPKWLLSSLINYTWPCNLTSSKIYYFVDAFSIEKVSGFHGWLDLLRSFNSFVIHLILPLSICSLAGSEVSGVSGDDDVNIFSCCVYIPESSKGLKFGFLNHPKETWGAEIWHPNGGSRYMSTCHI